MVSGTTSPTPHQFRAALVWGASFVITYFLFWPIDYAYSSRYIRPQIESLSVSPNVGGSLAELERNAQVIRTIETAVLCFGTSLLFCFLTATSWKVGALYTAALYALFILGIAVWIKSALPGKWPVIANLGSVLIAVVGASIGAFAGNRLRGHLTSGRAAGRLDWVDSWVSGRRSPRRSAASYEIQS